MGRPPVLTSRTKDLTSAAFRISIGTNFPAAIGPVRAVEEVFKDIG